MACIYMTADEGYEWTPTESGRAEGRISAKFAKDYHNKGQYQKKVPELWFKQGFVKQVRKSQ